MNQVKSWGGNISGILGTLSIFYKKYFLKNVVFFRVLFDPVGNQTFLGTPLDKRRKWKRSLKNFKRLDCLFFKKRLWNACLTHRETAALKMRMSERKCANTESNLIRSHIRQRVPPFSPVHFARLLKQIGIQDKSGEGVNPLPAVQAGSPQGRHYHGPGWPPGGGALLSPLHRGVLPTLESWTVQQFRRTREGRKGGKFCLHHKKKSPKVHRNVKFLFWINIVKHKTRWTHTEHTEHTEQFPFAAPLCKDESWVCWMKKERMSKKRDGAFFGGLGKHLPSHGS